MPAGVTFQGAAGHLVPVQPQGVAHRAPTLLHGAGGEGRRADHVAHRVEVVDARAAELVDREVAALGGRQAGGLHVQTLQAGRTAQRDEHLVAAQPLAALERGDDVARPVPGQLGCAVARDEAAACGLEVADEAVGQLGIEEAQGPRAAVDHGHLDAQGLEDARELRGDHAAAEDDERPRQVDHRQDRVAVEHVLVVDVDALRPARPRAGRDDDRVAGDPTALAVDGQHLDLPRRHEARPAPGDLDVVALDLLGHVVLVALEHAVEPVHQAAHGRVRRQGLAGQPGGPLLQARQVQGRLAQRLARDRAAVHALAADLALAVDQEHARPGLGALDGGLLARGSGADHHQVVAVDAHERASADSRTRSRRWSSSSSSSG